MGILSKPTIVRTDQFDPNQLNVVAFVMVEILGRLLFRAGR
jgi:hypothetical protein